MPTTRNQARKSTAAKLADDLAAEQARNARLDAEFEQFLRDDEADQVNNVLRLVDLPEPERPIDTNYKIIAERIHGRVRGGPIHDVRLQPDRNALVMASALLEKEDIKLSNYNIPESLQLFGNAMLNFLEGMIRKKGAIKVFGEVSALLQKYDPVTDTYKYGLFHKFMFTNKKGITEVPILVDVFDLVDFVKTSLKTAEEEIGQVDTEGSGWTTNGFPYVIIKTIKYKARAGMSHRELPAPIKSLEKKRKLLNIKNRDERCFLWCVVAWLSEYRGEGATDNKTRPTHYQRWLTRNPEAINLEGIEFPMTLDQISKFSEQNPELPPILVFAIELDVNTAMVNNGTAFHIVRHAAVAPGVSPIVLILLPEVAARGDEPAKNSHFVLAQEPWRLFERRGLTHDRRFVCWTHLKGFSGQERYDEHMRVCANYSNGITELPRQGMEIFFGATKADYKKLVASPYVVYADLETFTGENMGRVTAGGFKIVAAHSQAPHQYLRKFSGPGCLLEMLTQLRRDCFTIKDFLKHGVEMNLTAAEEAAFQAAEHCWICKNEFPEQPARRYRADGAEDEINHERPPNGLKVRDHCHLTGKFRGAAHNICNLGLNEKEYKLPVFFHNGRGFDFHYLAPVIAQISTKFEPLCRDFESLTMITTEYCQFLDSCLHQNTSLEKWIKATRSTGGRTEAENLPLTTAYFSGRYTPEAAALMCQKGHYPYEHIQTWDNLAETALPPPAAFASQLSGSAELKAKDHAHAQKVWDTLGCDTLLDYTEEYLISDILLLADCFEAYRKVCLQHYQLDPSRFVTAPSLAWKACLKKTGAKIKTFTEGQEDMLEFAEQNRRGGLVQSVTRHFECTDNDACSYIDANNLYGWAMKQPLPTGEFEWLQVDQRAQDDNALAAFSCEMFLRGLSRVDKGYLIECDVHCPIELHDKFNDLPLFPESKVGTPSTFMQQHYADEIIAPERRCNKLVADLKPKTHYGTHIDMLLFAIDQGYVCTKIHRVLKFSTKNWMEEYIDFNTNQRNVCKAAGDDVGSALFKLLNNSVYGKTCENVHNRANIKTAIWGDNARISKLGAQSHLKTYKVFENIEAANESYVAFAMGKTRVMVDKPVAVGVCVLELSKLLMYRAWYEKIKPTHPTATLLYMDTDSFIVGMKGTPEAPARFQFGDDLMDKNTLGLFKDELGGLRIKEVVSLRAKTYSVKTADPKEDILKAKGVPKKARTVNGAALSHAHYIAALTKTLPEDAQKIRYNHFRSRGHQMAMRQVVKKSCSAYDDKRWVLEDGIHSLAHGHHRIPADGGLRHEPAQQRAAPARA